MKHDALDDLVAEIMHMAFDHGNPEDFIAERMRQMIARFVNRRIDEWQEFSYEDIDQSRWPDDG